MSVRFGIAFFSEEPVYGRRERWVDKEKFVRKRSLQNVNEHFEQIFNAVFPSTAEHKQVLIISRTDGRAQLTR